MKTFELLNLSDILSRLPLGKLSIERRAALTRTVCAISRARKPFDVGLTEAKKKLVPDGYEELSGKTDRTPDEDARLKDMTENYNKAVHATIKPELNAEVTLTVSKPMTAEDLLALADCDEKWTLADTMWVANLLGIDMAE